MGIGLLKAHLEAFDAIGAGIAGIKDQRREGYDKQYEYADAIKGAYGVFFFQHPSMLEYQERLKQQFYIYPSGSSSWEQGPGGSWQQRHSRGVGGSFQL